MSTDHGLPADVTRQCTGTTQKSQQCKNHALVGRPFCFLHDGEAKQRRRASASDQHTIPPELLQEWREWREFFQQDSLLTKDEDDV